MSVSAPVTSTRGGIVADQVSPDTTIGLLLRQAERFGDETFVRFYDQPSERWATMSWNAFVGGVLRIANGLVNAGVQAQDRVLLLSENRVEWLLCDLGIQAAGAITVPVYASLLPASVQVMAADSAASHAIVSDASQAAKVTATAQAPVVVSMDSDVPRWMAGADGLAPEVEARLRNLRPEDVATIAYTSGTSGRPKGAVITHGILIAELESCRKAYDIKHEDVILSILPYAHIFERVAAFLFGAVLAGAELDLGRGPEHLLEDVQANRPTCMNGVPRIFEKVEQRVAAEVGKRSYLTRAMFRWSIRAGRRYVRAGGRGWLLRAQHALAERLVLREMRRTLTGGRLRFFLSGSAPLLPEVEEFFWAMGVPIYQGWGMTELTCAATCNTIDEHRLGTVGKPLPGVSLRLAPDGEIEVCGPGVMREYYRNPAATAEAIADGWMLTGDIGTIDSDGFLTITDRKKDMIKTSGGKFIAPQPIETRLQQDPHVQTAIVVGDGRPFATALIAPDWELMMSDLGLSGEPESLVDEPRVLAVIQKLVDGVNAGLARFETLKYFRLLPHPLTIARDEITPTLKVKRRAVQEHYRELIDDMYRRSG